MRPLNVLFELVFINEKDFCDFTNIAEKKLKFGNIVSGI
jgi:hypothetical protein